MGIGVLALVEVVLSGNSSLQKLFSAQDFKEEFPFFTFTPLLSKLSLISTWEATSNNTPSLSPFRLSKSQIV